MLLPMVCIVTDAARVDINRVWEARGLGPDNFSRKVCAIDPGATPATPPTHWLMSDAGASDAEVAIVQAMTAGTLPSGVAWGEGGLIAEADALAATDGAVLQVYTAAGDVEPVDHIAGILAGRGLQYVPAEEI